MMNDQELISHALHTWANYIETGHVTLSANDAVNHEIKPRPLDKDQTIIVQRIRKLASLANQGKIKIDHDKK